MASALSGEKTTIYSIWKRAFQNGGTRYVHQSIATDSSRRVLHTVNASGRAAMKIADGMKELLSGAGGVRVAILADGYGELFSLYHGLWLAGCTVIPIPSKLSPDVIAGILNNSNCRILIYSSALTAKLASIVSLVSTVTHMIMTGGSRTGIGPPAGKGSLKLDDVIRNSTRSVKIDDFKPQEGAEANTALIAITSRADGEPHGVAFSEEAIVAAASNQSYIYAINSERERVTSFLPEKHIVSLIHMLLVPLTAGIASVEFLDVRRGEPAPKLADELYDNQITAAWMDETMLPYMQAATKSQRFVLGENFRIFLLPQGPVIVKQIEGVHQIVVPCYAQTEAGGLIACGSKGQLHLSSEASASGTPVVAAGNQISGVKLNIVTKIGTFAANKEPGEVIVQSKQIMSGYEATNSGCAYLGPGSTLYTGDRALWSLDASGQRQIVIAGREENFIKRGDHEVNTFDLECVLQRVVGVKDVRIIPFSHTKYGHEIAAFVSIIKRAQVTQENLWANLLQVFPWEVVPKVFMMADSSQLSAIPSRNDLEAQLTRFASTDFARPNKQ